VVNNNVGLYIKFI